MNLKFEKAKILNELKRTGQKFVFKRCGVNEFGEPDEVVEEVVFDAIYHESNSYIKTTTKEASQYVTKKIPMLLGLLEQCELKNGDILEWRNNCYRVTGVTDVQEWGIIADVSLEVIQNG